jgi:DNA-binding CsgD family transcriptional regulator
MNLLSHLSALMLRLHQGARSQPVAGFIEWALGTLKEYLPFDSGLWAAAHIDPDGTPVVHLQHLHRQPAQLLADYQELSRNDTVLSESVRQPGVAVVADTRAWFPARFTAYLDRYRIEHVLNTCIVDARTGLLTDIALWRADRDQPFSEDERCFMEAAFPHLIEACTQNRLSHLVNSAAPRLAGRWRSAAADSTGLLHYVDSEFIRLLLTEWPEWTGPALPAPVMAAIRGGHAARITSQHLVFKLAPMTDLLLVQVRECTAIDRLTAREREVAGYTAQGLSHKEIARLLELSPATVRNHLAAACRRVQVRTKAQMAALVNNLE